MLEITIDVDRAAKILGVSERRVRTLLSQGRMTGWKDSSGWRVLYPLSILPGRRGPDLHRYPTRPVRAAPIKRRV